MSNELLDIALEKGKEAKALLDALEAQADFGEDAFADVTYNLCWLHDELTTEIRSLASQLQAARLGKDDAYAEVRAAQAIIAEALAIKVDAERGIVGTIGRIRDVLSRADTYELEAAIMDAKAEGYDRGVEATLVWGITYETPDPPANPYRVTTTEDEGNPHA